MAPAEDGTLSFSRKAKRLVKKLLPSSFVIARRNYLNSKLHREFSGLSLKESFDKIYAEGRWGSSGDPSDPFFSGSGSHEGVIVSEYLTAVLDFLRSFEKKPDVVDLGCGDFAIGSRVRNLCARYVACDIVEGLIARNKKKYKDLDVEFRVLDMTEDELPTGDVVFIRQVLQHLSNERILKVLPRIKEKYRYLVLSEHLAAANGFTPNLDKPAGPDTRTWLGTNGSGVVLTLPPFNLPVLDDRVLCTVEEVETGGVVRTNVYRLK